MSKNLRKVQDMLDGNYKSKIQSGYSTVEEHHKVGDKWTDSEGYEWEQKEGFKVKSGGSMPARGMFNHPFKADGRCYYCQIEFEDNLKFDKPIRWFAYRRLKDLINMESLEKDMIQWIDDMTEQNKKNPFDMKVANALANGEVEMQINKNKV